MKDAQTPLGGGSMTTSIALVLAKYCILLNIHILLRAPIDELAAAILDPARPLLLVELEKPEYFTPTT